ncbi:MAG: hypothetical protein P1U87_02445 [Verrucomicrobiales bacterium]|nr:hypothetical protein [Verrucomicrobiales bacterium]
MQTLPAVSEENIALTGKYLAVGNSSQREIGFSVWEQDGTSNLYESAGETKA